MVYISMNHQRGNPASCKGVQLVGELVARTLAGARESGRYLYALAGAGVVTTIALYVLGRFLVASVSHVPHL